MRNFKQQSKSIHKTKSDIENCKLNKKKQKNNLT